MRQSIKAGDFVRVPHPDGGHAGAVVVDARGDKMAVYTPAQGKIKERLDFDVPREDVRFVCQGDLLFWAMPGVTGMYADVDGDIWLVEHKNPGDDTSPLEVTAVTLDGQLLDDEQRAEWNAAMSEPEAFPWRRLRNLKYGNI